MEINGLSEKFPLARPKELSYGEDCPRCGKGKVPLWEGEIIYPYCAGCAIIIEADKLRREQEMEERRMNWEAPPQSEPDGKRIYGNTKQY